MKLIVGLGNPGKQYDKTRHNVGFMALDQFHAALKPYSIGKWEVSKKFNAEIAGCTVNGEKLLLAKPLTFMNGSGQSVGLLAHYYNIPVRDVIVVHDEKDIPLGEYKIQVNRGPAGHNGVKSIIEHLGSQDFTRIRIGIRSAKEEKMKEVSKFVLGRFGMFEKKPLAQTLAQTTDDLVRLTVSQTLRPEMP